MASVALSCALIPCLGSIAIEKMELEEKIGQVMMVHFNGTEANEDAKALVNEVHVGGFIYYNWSNGLTSFEQVKNLGSGLQELAQKTRLAIPLFIAADQEGGIVARLTQGFTVFPGNKALGMTGEPELAEQSAFAMGLELQAAGVNFNLAPVVDVNINPRNPVIGIRSFGDSPEVVARLAEKALQGYRRAGVITSLKHFPGHGRPKTDSHYDLPVVSEPLDELLKVELFPFAKLAAMADSIMTAHLLVPALDPDNCSTLSEKTLTFLRKDLGFEGAIISDSLVMEGVLKKCGSVDEAAIQALKAGCDILILGGKQLIGDHKKELTVADVKQVHRSLVDAVKTGRISMERLDEAVQRVFELKKRIFIKPISINWSEHQALALKIARKAVRVVKNNILNFSEKKVAVIGPALMRDVVQKTSLAKAGKGTELVFFEGLNPPDSQTILEKTASSDVLVVCSYNSWKNPLQQAMIESLIKTGKPVILFVVRDPLDETLFPEASAIITTYSPTVPSVQAGWDQSFSSF